MKSLQYFVKTFLVSVLLVSLGSWLTLAGFEGTFNLYSWSFEARDFFSAIIICTMICITIFLAFKVIVDM